MAFSKEQQVQIIAEANRRAIANGTTVAAEIAKEAQKNGLSMAQAEQQMGYPSGTLGGQAGSGPNGAGGAGTAQGSSPYMQSIGAYGTSQQLPYNGPANPVNSPATPTNLGMGSKLDDTTRNGVIAEAQRRATANGTTPEAELYKYSQSQGQTPAQLDALMGFSSGSAAQWAQQNGGQNGVAAPQGNIRAQPSGNQGYGINNGITNNDRPTTGGFNTDDSFYGLAQPPGNQPAWGNQSNLGFGDSGYQRNPYLDQASRDIGSQMFDTWSRQIAPSIRSNAMAAGGYGGSRQGVVEANALNDMQRNYGQALTSMYGQDYTNFQNRGITRQGQAQSYDLGLRNNDTANWSLDAGINQNNFNNNLASANFGLGVQNQLMNNNGVGIAAGTNIQNTPFDYQKYLNTAGVQAGGAGGTRTGTTTS